MVKENDTEQVKITVNIGRLSKMLTQLRGMGFQNSDEVSFEYVMGSLFPTAYKSLKESLAYQYTTGYIEGLSENKEINKTS